MNSKQLHLHAVPIIILSIGLLTISIMAIERFTTTSAYNNSISQLLDVRLFTIKPAANGLFHISRYKSPGTQASADLLSVNQSVGNLAGTDNVGRIAVLNFMMNSPKR